jgi:CTP-dependent riboflavin kinase
VSSFEFQGTYQPRSSRPGACKTSGEKNILKINPERVKRLTDVTGWPKLYLGSLNLAVADAVISNLESLKELYFEHPELITYPDGFNSPSPAEHRGGYNYYRGRLSGSANPQEILIRRGKVNPIRGRVETYAPISLQEHFNLNKGDTISVTVWDA